MATVRQEHITKLMQEKELPFWRLTDNTGVRMMIAENDTEENVSKSIELLTEALEMIEDNFVCVTLSDKTKKQKSRGGRDYQQFEFKVNLRRGETGISGAGNNGLMAMMLAQMAENAKLQTKIAENAKDKQIDTIQRQLDDLKSGSAGSKMFSQYKPYLDVLFGVNKSHGIASAGEDDEIVDATVIDAKAKVRAAIKQLIKVDPDFPDTITMLAAFAVKHPDKYKQFVPMVQNMI